MKTDDILIWLKYSCLNINYAYEQIFMKINCSTLLGNGKSIFALIIVVFFLLTLDSCAEGPMEVDNRDAIGVQRKGFALAIHEIRFEDAYNHLDSILFLVNDETSLQYIDYLFLKADLFERLRQDDLKNETLVECLKVCKEQGYSDRFASITSRLATSLDRSGLAEGEPNRYFENLAALKEEFPDDSDVNRAYLEYVQNKCFDNNDGDRYFTTLKEINCVDSLSHLHLTEKFNLGIVYCNQDSFQKSLKVFDQVGSDASAVKDSTTMCNYYNYVTKNFLGLKNYNAMLNSMNQGILICTEILDYPILIELYDSKRKLNKILGNDISEIEDKIQSIQFKVDERKLGQSLAVREQQLRVQLRQRELEYLKDKTNFQKSLFVAIGIALSAICLSLFFVNRISRKRRKNLEQLYKSQDRVNALEQEKVRKDYEQRLIKSNVIYANNLYDNMARKLHDELGSTLTGLKLKLSLVKEKYGAQELETTMDDLKEVSLFTRDMSHSLKPPKLTPGEFVDFLNEYVRDIVLIIPAKLNFVVGDASRVESLPTYLKTELYRIVQEGLTNIVKHAKASQVELYIEFDEDALFLSLKDDGLGIDSTELSKGLGLQGMRERVELMKGSFDISSKNDGGTTIKIKLPLME